MRLLVRSAKMRYILIGMEFESLSLVSPDLRHLCLPEHGVQCTSYLNVHIGETLPHLVDNDNIVPPGNQSETIPANVTVESMLV